MDNRIALSITAINDFFQTRHWAYCIIGGLAVLRWGETRFTQDIDIALLTGWGNEETFAEELLKEFSPRITDAQQFAVQNRVLLIQTREGVNCDITFSALPFEQQMIDRANPWELCPGVIVPICTAEDLLIMKIFAGRDKDMADAKGVFQKQKGHLDTAYIRGRIGELHELKGEPEMMERARGICEKFVC